MKTTTTAVIRYLAGPTLAVGFALAAPAVANAERVWDIGAYDSCMAQMPNYSFEDRYKLYDYIAGCCARSGGDFVNDGGTRKCVSPPAEAENVPGNTNPTGQPRPPVAPGGSGVSDDPTAGAPQPTVPLAPRGGVG